MDHSRFKKHTTLTIFMDAKLDAHRKKDDPGSLNFKSILKHLHPECGDIGPVETESLKEHLSCLTCISSCLACGSLGCSRVDPRVGPEDC